MQLVKGRQLTILVVGGVFGLAILGYIWIAPMLLWIKVFCTILALYEAWTLVNKEQNDTITEGIAYLAGISQLVPFLFGIGYGYILGAKYITDPIIASVVGLLMGHFFFSQKVIETKAIIQAVEEKNG